MTIGNAHDQKFQTLLAYVCRIPSVYHNETPSLGIGTGDDGDGWWLKFTIDTEHPLAWNVVQELGHVLNYLSPNERLPTTFKPVSPPPYLNGGPREFLSWIIECGSKDMNPDMIVQWLEARLPRPVDDVSRWTSGLD
jgi:hypothetical protein